MKENHDCSNMVANILSAHPRPLTLGSIRRKSTSLEHGHVAYQIKENHEMQQHGCNMVDIVQISLFFFIELTIENKLIGF